MVADVITKPVDALPGKGLLSQVDSIGMYTGGNAMTAAINIAKIGPKSAVIGKVGQDAFGDFLIRSLQEKNIDASSVKRDASAQTSSSVVLSDFTGERTFLHCVGANGTFSLSDIDFDKVEQAAIVFVTGSFLMNTFDGEQTAAFLKRCKEMGKTTALDVCYDSHGRWSQVLDQCLPYLDIFLPSIDEAIELSGGETDPQKIADSFFDKGVGSVVIKMGGKGCYIRENRTDQGEVLPIFKVKAVDTTGAGDSFCSGFLAALSMGHSFRECALFGNAAGACCVMAKGATTAMRDYAGLKALIEEYQP